MLFYSCSHSLFFFNHPATTEIYTLSLHDALPILARGEAKRREIYKFLKAEVAAGRQIYVVYPLVEESEALDLKAATRSEEHTSELQSLTNLVCRLLLEKKKNKTQKEK